MIIMLFNNVMKYEYYVGNKKIEYKKRVEND